MFLRLGPELANMQSFCAPPMPELEFFDSNLLNAMNLNVDECMFICLLKLSAEKICISYSIRLLLS